MQVTGTQIDNNVLITVKPSVVIEKLIEELGFGEDYFIKDTDGESIYRREYVGTHKREVRDIFVTSDQEKIKVLKSLLYIAGYIRKMTKD